MTKRTNIGLFVALALISCLGATRARACSWAIGYFFQVTQLKGTVVGSNFPVLHSFRRFRQSFVRANTNLTLYKYCWPCDVRKLSAIKKVVTDKEGKFDFGSLKPDHYILVITDGDDDLSDQFDVEVKGPPNKREFETIDISPNYPDCSGGHEFIIHSK